jgi:hypothetical protein
MKKIISTLLLAVVAIAALVWALSYPLSGLAWFPGFLVAVFCGIRIMDVNGIGQEGKNTRKCDPGC